MNASAKLLLVVTLILTGILIARAAKPQPATSVWYLLEETPDSKTVRPELTIGHNVYSTYSAKLNRGPHPMMLIAIGNRLSEPVTVDLTCSYIVRNGVKSPIALAGSEEAYLTLNPKQGKALETPIDLVPYGSTDYGDLFKYVPTHEDWVPEGQTTDFRFAANTDGLQQGEVRDFTEAETPFTIETIIAYRVSDDLSNELKEVRSKFYVSHEIGTRLSDKPLSDEEKKLAEKTFPALATEDHPYLVMKLWSPFSQKK